MLYCFNLCPLEEEAAGKSYVLPPVFPTGYRPRQDYQDGSNLDWFLINQEEPCSPPPPSDIKIEGAVHKSVRQIVQVFSDGNP